MDSSDIQSKTIDYLRFPLIVAVVFIHNYSSTVIISGTELGNGENLTLFNFSSEFFSHVIASIAVPLFFLFSGYLFFLKGSDRFDFKIYCSKLRKRFRSLLIPYLFWNIAFLIFYYAISKNPLTQNWFSSPDYSINYIFSALWSIEGVGSTSMTHPISYQFWFIRDLMVVSLLTPILFKLIRICKIYYLLLLLFLWIFSYWPASLNFYGGSITCLLFFSIGAYLSINNLNLCTEFNRFSFLSYSCYPILALFDLFTKGSEFNYLFHNIGILVGILFVVNLVSFLFSRNIIRSNTLLSGASFFVFAIHEPWLLSQYRKLFYTIFQPVSDIELTLLYFFIPIVVIITALLVYSLLKKSSPKFLGFIVGR